MRWRRKRESKGGGDRNGATEDERSGRDASSYTLTPCSPRCFCLLSLLYFPPSPSLFLQLFHPFSICANFAVLVSVSLSSTLLRYSIFLPFTFPRIPFSFLPPPLVSATLSLLFFSLPRSVSFPPLSLSLSRDFLAPSLFYFHFHVPLVFSLHPERTSFSVRPLAPSLSRIFIFIFPFSRAPLRPAGQTPADGLSRAGALSVESVRNERNDYGANGVAMSPTGYRVSGRDWQQSIRALSFTVCLAVVLQNTAKEYGN